MSLFWLMPVFEEFFFNDNTCLIANYFFDCDEFSPKVLREVHYRQPINHEIWVEYYHELEFFRLFRMRKETFFRLMNVVLENDIYLLIKKKYRGGNYPTSPEKALLVFLCYMSRQETLHAIGDRFNLVPSTVMCLINAFLYIIVGLKKKYIYWPGTEEEYDHVKQGFTNYPGAIGAVDGCHVEIKVPFAQHTSYIDRKQNHSINLMAVCTADKIFSYVFIGYPGSAHDSRVFSNSQLVRHIERFGKNKYFPEDLHLLGDSAFPLRTWLMKPYARHNNLTRIQKLHNYKLSADRVCIENSFGILKLRWARLKYINTYCISKAIEITTAACVLHNFCYLNNDEWDDFNVENNVEEELEFPENDREAYLLGEEKRDAVAETIFLNN